MKDFPENSPNFLPMLILTAHPSETKPLVEILSLKKLEKMDNRNCFSSPKRKIFLSEIGVGFTQKDADFVRNLGSIGPRLIINIGFCGALDSTFSLLDFYRIEDVYSEEFRKIELRSELNSDLLPVLDNFNTANLLTVKKPVLRNLQREKLFQKYQCSLVDMEAFKIARVAEDFKIPLLVFKLISDNADESTTELFKKNMKRLQQELSARFISILQQLND